MRGGFLRASGAAKTAHVQGKAGVDGRHLWEVGSQSQGQGGRAGRKAAGVLGFALHAV